MAAQPNDMKIGTALGMLGGIISIAALGYCWDGGLDGLYGAGLNMLCAVMFFALAGAFTRYSPVAGNSVIGISAVAIASVVIGVLYDATLLWVSILLLVIAIACLLIAACPKTVGWIDGNRVI